MDRVGICLALLRYLIPFTWLQRNLIVWSVKEQMLYENVAKKILGGLFSSFFGFALRNKTKESVSNVAGSRYAVIQL